MAQWNMLYDMYERRLKAELSDAAVPAHIGVILDGNRRWRSHWVRPPRRGTALAPEDQRVPPVVRRRGCVDRDAVAPLNRQPLARAGELGELLSIICEAVSLLADQGAGSWPSSATSPCCPRRLPRTCVRPSRAPRTCRG